MNKTYLHCRSEKKPVHVEKLQEIIDLGVFELLYTNNEYKLVYLMNDAVESFLMFQNAHITGTYEKENSINLYADLDYTGTEYVLIVHQETKNVFSIFFEELELQVELYNYSQLGHFWIKKAEELRQLEYKIAILNDKLDFLGEDYCSKEERSLASLLHFAPIQSFPSVPKKYRVLRENSNIITKESIDYMKNISKKAKDTSFYRTLCLYEKFPCKLLTRFLSNMLCHNKHYNIISILIQHFSVACDDYPERTFSKADTKRFKKLIDQSLVQLSHSNAKGYDARIWYEEPFVHAEDDDFDFQVHVLERHSFLGKIYYKRYSFKN